MCKTLTGDNFMTKSVELFRVISLKKTMLSAFVNSVYL